MTFDKVLIANRGEIARRIIATCRDMGFATVAVYSDADATAPHVAEADEAVRLGPAPASESYLAIDRVLDAARLTGAGAIHPGYGFLAENAAFARACEEAGVVFVGPTAATIDKMGSKIEAKALVAAANVAVVPGFDGGDQSDAAFVAAADDVGYPLLVKASAGGGGKGMRVVGDKASLLTALATARRVARSAFGDDRLLLEHYLTDPRHIEVQILGDSHGNLIHLFERECSIQRRHQKIVEETPSPACDDTLRAALTEAALSCGRALSYRSAGTVEFIVAPDGRFYFLEVNTRLQVEHPVTEVVTGLDLVRLQLEVALGKPLTLSQAEVRQTGHAIECRLYAEDPAQNYLPQTGQLYDWQLPSLPGIRVDSGVGSGSTISVDYDPMIAKVIAGGATRDDAIRRLRRALDQIVIAGIVTNREQLKAILDNAAFRQGQLTTHFLEDHAESLAAAALSEQDIAAAAVAATIAGARRRHGARAILKSLPLGFRNNLGDPPIMRWTHGASEVAVGYRALGEDRFRVTVDEATIDVRVIADDGVGNLVLDQGGHLRSWRLSMVDEEVWAHTAGLPSVRLQPVPRFPLSADVAGSDGCRAPMTGKVISVQVAVGDAVEAGQVLVVLEAMKMEHPIEAPRAGHVAEIAVAVGEVVDAQTEVVVFGPGPTAS